MGSEEAFFIHRIRVFMDSAISSISIEQVILIFVKYLVKTNKFVYSEKATKFCEIFTLLLTTVHTTKSKVKISQHFEAFSEYMSFKIKLMGVFQPKLYVNKSPP